MLRGCRSVGTLLGLLLVGCSASSPPGSNGGSEQEAIVGGATDTTDKAVFGIVINGMALCSGSLIAPNLLLTARHCVADLSTGDAPITCGTSTFEAPFPPSAFVTTYDADLNDGASTNSAFGIAEVRVPPDSAFCGNDIALLILDDNVPSATIPTLEPRLGEGPQTNEAFRAVGYGLNNPNDTQGISAGVRRNNVGSLAVGCVGSTECSGSGAMNSEWAAYAPICHGDSGGPALDAEGRVIGVASRADETCEIGLYSAVATWKDLILDAADDAADRGGYAPPTWAGGEPMTDGGVPAAGASAGGSSGTAGSSGRGGSAGAGKGGASNAGAGGSGGTTGNAGGAGGSGGLGGRGATAGEAGRSMLPPDAGTPDSGLPMNGGALGDACTGTCSGALLCYSSTGTPPGECVPACSAQRLDCPAHYQCSVKLGACTPQGDADAGSNDSRGGDDDVKKDAGCGCRVTPASDATAATWQSIPLVLLLGAALRRRRRAARE
jgi:hypothetical protein